MADKEPYSFFSPLDSPLWRGAKLEEALARIESPQKKAGHVALMNFVRAINRLDDPDVRRFCETAGQLPEPAQLASSDDSLRWCDVLLWRWRERDCLSAFWTLSQAWPIWGCVMSDDVTSAVHEACGALESVADAGGVRDAERAFCLRLATEWARRRGR